VVEQLVLKGPQPSWICVWSDGVGAGAGGGRASGLEICERDGRRIPEDDPVSDGDATEGEGG